MSSTTGGAGSPVAGATPAELARDAFKQLAARRIPPTPENYARVYAERAGRPLGEVQPAIAVLEAILSDLHLDPARASIAAEVEDALEHGDWKTVQSKLKSAFSTQPAKPVVPNAATITAPNPVSRTAPHPVARTAPNPVSRTAPHPVARTASSPAASGVPLAITQEPGEKPTAQSGIIESELVTTLKGLVAKIVTFCIHVDLGYSSAVAAEASELASAVQKALTAEDITGAASRLRHFWIELELHGEGPQHMVRSLHGLLQLLMHNLGDLVADDRWVRGQVVRIEALLSEPLTPALISEAERSFKDYLLRQGTLKHSLDEARSTIRNMMATLVVRLGSITSSTRGYTTKLSHYSERIRAAESLSDISDALGSLLSDTQSMHGDMTRTHSELQDTQSRVEAHEARVRQLEEQLAELSLRVGEDPLTEVLNRRGLDQQYLIEEARVKRKNTPLCVAILDVDNFKQLNDTYGHAAGDRALKHLVEVVRQVIRPTDSLARYGGEEFVILLPETSIENAEKVMVRVQRELTKRFFLHNNERLLITFSAGVAQRRPDETQPQVIERADLAMYRAKRAGKNRVERAD